MLGSTSISALIWYRVEMHQNGVWPQGNNQKLETSARLEAVICPREACVITLILYGASQADAARGIRVGRIFIDNRRGIVCRALKGPLNGHQTLRMLPIGDSSRAR